MIPRDYTDTDGMITNVPGLVLATFYADCVPLYFADPANHAIGLSHSGLLTSHCCAYNNFRFYERMPRKAPRFPLFPWEAL